MTEKESLFDKFMKVDVSKHTYKKPANKSGSVQLSYLSWSWAYAYMRYFDEDAKMSFVQYPEYDFQAHQMTGRKLDYMNTGNGCYVTCKITIKGETREQSLPVMDYKNQSIKNPTTMDVNKAKQRCFVKCLALFGLGLSLYGLKDTATYAPKSNNYQKRSYSNGRIYNGNSYKKDYCTEKQVGYIKGLLKQTTSDGSDQYGWLENHSKTLNTMPFSYASRAIKFLTGLKKKQKTQSQANSVGSTDNVKQTTLLK